MLITEYESNRFENVALHGQTLHQQNKHIESQLEKIMKYASISGLTGELVFKYDSNLLTLDTFFINIIDPCLKTEFLFFFPLN